MTGASVTVVAVRAESLNAGWAVAADADGAVAPVIAAAVTTASTSLTKCLIGSCHLGCPGTDVACPDRRPRSSIRRMILGITLQMILVCIFCVSDQEADEAPAHDPAIYTAVRRHGARRSFLGL